MSFGKQPLKLHNPVVGCNVAGLNMLSPFAILHSKTSTSESSTVKSAFNSAIGPSPVAQIFHSLKNTPNLKGVTTGSVSKTSENVSAKDSRKDQEFKSSNQPIGLDSTSAIKKKGKLINEKSKLEESTKEHVKQVKKDSPVQKMRSFSKAVKPVLLKDWMVRDINKKGRTEINIEGEKLEGDNFVMWHTSAITERIDSLLVGTASGSCYQLQGKMNIERAEEFSDLPSKFLQAFIHGFPSNWKELLENLPSPEKKTEQNHTKLSKTNSKTTNKYVCPHAGPMTLRSRNKPVVPQINETRKSSENVTDATVKIVEKDKKKQTRKSVKQSNQAQQLSEKKDQAPKPSKKTSTNVTTPKSQNPDSTLGDVTLDTLPQTRLGRRVVPPLAWWRSERLRQNQSENDTTLLKGTPDYMADLAQSIQKRKRQRPSVKRKAKPSRPAVRKPESLKVSGSASQSDSSKQKTSLKRKVKKKDSKPIKATAKVSPPLKRKSKKAIPEKESKSTSLKKPSAPKRKATKSSKVVENTKTESKISEVYDSCPIDVLLTPEKPKVIKKHKSVKRKSVVHDSSDEDIVQTSAKGKQKAPVNLKSGTWTKKEISDFYKVKQSILPTSSNYWGLISMFIGTKSIAECIEFHQKETTFSKTKPKKKGKKTVTSPSQITGGKKTLKRKRQLKELIEHHNEGHEDDFFDATPNRNMCKVKIPRLSMDDSFNDFYGNEINFETPANVRQAQAVYQPTSEKKTPAAGVSCASPDVVSSDNARNMDQYVHRLKQRMHSFKPIRQQRTPEVLRKAPQQGKTMEPIASLCPVKDNSQLFKDDDEDEDFYFSETESS